MSSDITRFRGLRRSPEAHLLEAGELSAARNMVNREGILTKRPGFTAGSLRLETATYWPQSVFHLTLPRENLKDEEQPEDPEEPPENGVIWGPPEPGGEDDPEVFPPINIRGGGAKVARKLRFVVELPFEIAEGSSFTLKITAERYWGDPWNGWVKDDEYNGVHASWRAYVYDAGIGGTTVAVNRSGLVLDNGNTFYLDPRRMADGDPRWTNGVWQGKVKLLEDEDRNTFRLNAWHGWKDKGEATAEINPAPCSCPCEGFQSYPYDNPCPCAWVIWSGKDMDTSRTECNCTLSWKNNDSDNFAEDELARLGDYETSASATRVVSGLKADFAYDIYLYLADDEETGAHVDDSISAEVGDISGSVTQNEADDNATWPNGNSAYLKEFIGSVATDNTGSIEIDLSASAAESAESENHCLVVGILATEESAP